MAFHDHDGETLLAECATDSQADHTRANDYCVDAFHESMTGR